MTFTVLLDTCVLYPAHLRDTLLRLAERGLFRVLWSADILEELRVSLTQLVDGSVVDRLLTEMAHAFPDSEVEGYGPFIEGLTCDPKDRHVLAAALRGNADAIITFNVRDFPDDSVEPFGIEVMHPDILLLDEFDLTPRVVVGELNRQAVATRRTPNTLSQIIDALERAGAPDFADAVRQQIGEPSEDG